MFVLKEWWAASGKNSEVTQTTTSKPLRSIRSFWTRHRQKCNTGKSSKHSYSRIFNRGTSFRSYIRYKNASTLQRLLITKGNYIIDDNKHLKGYMNKCQRLITVTMKCSKTKKRTVLVVLSIGRLVECSSIFFINFKRIYIFIVERVPNNK